MGAGLEWLPEYGDWAEALARARQMGAAEAAKALEQMRWLAGFRMDLTQTLKLDRAVRALAGQEALAGGGSLASDGGPTAGGNLANLVSLAGDDGRLNEHGLANLQGLADRGGLGDAARTCGMLPVRLALLGSATTAHLVPGIRVAGLRHNLLIETYEGTYGAYRQELADAGSGLHRFGANLILLALDARHVAAQGSAEAALDAMEQCWRLAKAHGVSLLQQTVLPVLPGLLGNNEHRLGDGPAGIVQAVNARLRTAAEAAGVSLLAVDELCRQEGLERWHDASLWHRAKQEIHPGMAAAYGEQVARVVGAIFGQSRKCLVLDLDHTLWGGGIGDDGLEGIAIGPGSAVGEAHLELQRYARDLMRRGVVLAVCSKNDEANALLPFERHPGMLLRREDIVCFVANWEDKATNLRRIAKTLRLGLEALVFVDDNPAERGLVRRELAMVAVPEMPADPAEYVRVLAAAGYFESVAVTAEDRLRAGRYAAEAQRVQPAGGDAADLDAYLAGLKMELAWRPVDESGMARVVQLINKTNQFNLTTRRTSEAELRRRLGDVRTLTLQFALSDVYGDNGTIAVAIAVPAEQDEGLRRFAPGAKDLAIDTWLMSCRVLGRQVEEAVLNVMAGQARERGAQALYGRYLPTQKNGMVRDLYRRLGFRLLAETPAETLWVLRLQEFAPREVPVRSVAATAYA